MKPKVVILALITLLCLTSFAGISSYVVIDNTGLDTDVFLQAPLFNFSQGSVNILASIKRAGLELQLITPLLMRGITFNIGITQNYDLMIKESDFTPGFGIGFSLRF